MLLISQVEWLDWLNIFTSIWLLIYLYKSMRKVYGQRRAKTVIKFLTLLLSFMFVLVVALIGISLYTFSQL